MGIVRSIRNVTGGYTSSQVKVRDATANDDNPPPRMLMQDIADLTYDSHEVLLIMDMIDKRSNDKGKYWRHVQKSLILLDYLVHVGSERVVSWCNENSYIVKTLREFSYRDDTGRDVGGPIRERATRSTSLVMDTERLEEERARFARGGRNRRRYRRNSKSSMSRSSPPREASDDDDELARALQLSKETAAQEEERRRMAGRSAADNDLQRAMEMSQQNQMDMLSGMSYQQQQQQLYLQQQQQQQDAALAQAQQEYLQTQQQAQLEAQRLYEMQVAQDQQNAYQQQLLMQQQYEQQLQQQQAQQQQAQQPTQEPLQPLKTGSNNPFAAFNQQQAQKTSQEPFSSTSTGSRQRSHRQSTFDRDHMDRLDSISTLDAPMDTFGNTGMAKIPAQHTENTGFVDSSGRGLTAASTARKTGSNNPFSSNTQTQQYTGIASTQMQPAHTGYGFGNANHSTANSIDS